MQKIQNLSEKLGELAEKIGNAYFYGGESSSLILMNVPRGLMGFKYFLEQIFPELLSEFNSTINSLKDCSQRIPEIQKESFLKSLEPFKEKSLEAKEFLENLKTSLPEIEKQIKKEGESKKFSLIIRGRKIEENPFFTYFQSEEFQTIGALMNGQRINTIETFLSQLDKDFSYRVFLASSFPLTYSVTVTRKNFKNTILNV